MLTSRGSPFLKSTLNGVISTVYVSPGCTPYSVTLVLLVVIGDWSELSIVCDQYTGQSENTILELTSNEKVQSTIVFNTPLYSTDHPLYKQCFIVYYVITKDNLWRYKVRFVVYTVRYRTCPRSHLSSWCSVPHSLRIWKSEYNVCRWDHHNVQ